MAASIEDFAPPAEGESPLEQQGANPLGTTKDTTRQPVSSSTTKPFDEEEAQRRLARGEQVTMPDGTIRSWVITPEIFRQQGGTYDDPILGPGNVYTTTARYGVAELQRPEWNIPLSAEELEAHANNVDLMMASLEQTSPRTVKALTDNPQMLFMIPELAAAYDEKLEGWGPAEEVLNYLTTDLDMVGYEDFRQQSESTQQFFAKNSNFFSGEELDLLATVLAAQADNWTRSNIMAQANRWVDRGEDVGARDLSSSETRQEFLIWLYSLAQREEQRSLSEETSFGKIVSPLDKPRLYVTNKLADFWGWAASSGNPDEYGARKGLSLGQQIAFTVGQDPSEGGWEGVSGTFDALGAIALDPANLLLGLGAGSKLAKTGALADDIINMGKAARFGTALKAAVPVYGRGVVKAPMFSRAPSTRFFYTLLGKSMDEMVEVAGKKGLYTNMEKILAKEGLTGLFEQYPQFEHLAGSKAADMLLDATSADHIKDIVKSTYKQDYLNKASDVFVEAQKTASRTKKVYADEVTAGLRSGRFGLSQVDGVLDNVNVRAGVFRGTTDGVLTRSAVLGDDSTAVVLLGKKIVTKNIADDGSLASYAVWAAKNDRTVSTLAGLSDEATETVRRLASEGVEVSNLDDFSGVDDIISQMETLRTAGAAREVTSVVSDGKTFSVIRAGDMGSARYGLVDEAGEVVSAISADFIAGGGGANSVRTGEGLFTILTDAIMDYKPAEANRMLVALAEDISITEDGAKAIMSMAKRALTAPNLKLSESVISKVQSGALNNLGTQELASIRRYGKALGADIVSFGTDEAPHVLTERGLSKAVEVLDGTATTPAWKELGDLGMRAVKSDGIARSLKNGDARTWIIKNLPPVPRWRDYDMVDTTRLRPWRKVASNDTDGWFGQFKRTATAKVFGQEVPLSLQTDDAVSGAKDLRNYLKQMGVKRETIIDSVNQFYAADWGDRQQLVRKILSEAASEIDHPIAKHGFVTIIDDIGVKSFSMLGGEEVGMVASQSRKGFESAVPVYPSHLSNKVVLPGPEFFRMGKRFRGAKKLDFFGGRKFLEGFNFTGTKNSRKVLVERYKNMLLARGVDFADEGLTDQDFLMMAYATISKGGDSGIGKLSQALDYSKDTYLAFHSVFKRAMLAGSPFRWAGKVAVLEESIRGSMMEMSTWLRNPFRFAGDMVDAHAIQVLADTKKVQVKLISEVLDSAIPAGRVTTATIDNLDDTFKGFKEFLGDKQITTQRQLRSAMSNFFQDSVPTLHSIKSVGAKGRLARHMRRTTKKVIATEKTMADLGLATDMRWADADIHNKGWTQLFGEQLSSDVARAEWKPGAMGSRDISVISDMYAKQLWMQTNDPIARVGMRRVRAAALNYGVPADATASALAGTGAWKKMKSNVKAIGEFRGWEWADDVELAQRYLDEIIDPLTEEWLSPLWWKGGEDAVDEKARVLGELLDGRSTKINVGDAEINLNFPSGAPGSSRNGVRDLLTIHAEDTAFPLPQWHTGTLDMRFAMANDTGGILKPYKAITNKIMEYAGERTTQVLNRRPAWLAHFGEQFEYYKALGFNDEGARALASESATEMVNYVMYNMDNATPFLNSMGRVIPFFQAMWEVTQTWTYKIPFAKGGLIGAPTMVHKVDRVLDGLLNSGLLQYEYMEDPKKPGTHKITNVSLVFGDNPEELGISTKGGSVVSDSGYNMMKGPLEVATKALINMRNFFSEEPDIDFDPGMVKDTFKFAVGNPFVMNPDNPMSSGIMGVNGLYAGVNPAVNYAVTKMRTLTNFGVDNKLVDAVADETLADIAARNNLTADQFIIANSIALQGYLGNDKLAQLKRGQLDPAEVVLTGEEYFELPGTSLMSTILDDVFFSFGKEDSLAGSLYGLTPSWASYALRGFGIWGASGDPKAFAMVNDDGELQLPEVNAFLEGPMTPQSRMQVASEINNAMLHLETSEQLLTRWAKQAALLEDLTRQAVEQGGYEVVGEGQDQHLQGGNSPEFAEAWHEQKIMLKQWNDYIIKRAGDIAGGSMLMRGLVGLVAPATPRMFYDEQQQTQTYWSALDIAEGAGNRGSENYKKAMPKTLEDFQVQQTLVQKFLEDPSGDASKSWFWKNYPEVAVFLTPRTFWGPNGAPLPFTGFEDYGREVQAGRKLPLPPGVVQRKMLEAAIYAEKEVDVLSRYGGDSAEKEAWNIIDDAAAYKELGDETRIKIAGLDWVDDLINGGQYLHWKQDQEKDFDDTLTLAEELSRRSSNLEDAIYILEDLVPSQDMSDEDRSTYTQALRGAADGARNLAKGYRDLLDSSQYDSPRDAIISWYYDSVVGSYYDGLATFYESMEGMTDSEDKSRIFEDIRQYENAEFLSQYKHPDGGTLPFPNALEYSWGQKTAEEKSDKRLDWLGRKPEWLGMYQTSKLVEHSPQLRPYLPTVPQDFAIYKQYNDELNWLADQNEPGSAYGPTLAKALTDDGVAKKLAEFTGSTIEEVRGMAQLDRTEGAARLASALQDENRVADFQNEFGSTRAMTNNEQKKYKEGLVEWLEIELAKQGRSKEWEFRDLYPIERLSLAGELPVQFEKYVPNVTYARQYLESIDEGPDTQDYGRYMFDQIALKIEEDAQADASMLPALLELTGTVWGRDTWDGGLPMLLYGEFSEY